MLQNLGPNAFKMLFYTFLRSKRKNRSWTDCVERRGRFPKIQWWDSPRKLPKSVTVPPDLKNDSSLFPCLCSLMMQMKHVTSKNSKVIKIYKTDFLHTLCKKRLNSMLGFLMALEVCKERDKHWNQGFRFKLTEKRLGSRRQRQVLLPWSEAAVRSEKLRTFSREKAMCVCMNKSATSTWNSRSFSEVLKSWTPHWHQSQEMKALSWWPFVENVIQKSNNWIACDWWILALIQRKEVLLSFCVSPSLSFSVLPAEKSCMESDLSIKWVEPHKQLANPLTFLGCHVQDPWVTYPWRTSRSGPVVNPRARRTWGLLLPLVYCWEDSGSERMHRRNRRAPSLSLHADDFPTSLGSIASSHA